MVRTIVVNCFVRMGLYGKAVEIINLFKTKRQAHLMHKYGLEMLEAAQTAFDEVGVQAFLTYGCLLGAYRDHGFISYDPDIDLGVISDQVPGNMCEVLANYGFVPFRANRLSDENKTIVEETFEFKGLHLDVFHYFRENDDLYSVIQRRHETKEWREANRTDGFPCDRSYVPCCEMEKRDFLGVQVWMPKDTDGWLRAIYSESYMTPIKNWNAKDGYETRIIHSDERSYRLYF